MLDLLLPRTDAGVAVQIVTGVVVFAALFALTRSRPELRFLVAAAAFVAFALIGLRAAH